MELLAKVRPGDSYQAPTWRVRCPQCSAVYLLTTWRQHAMKTPRCMSCAGQGNQNQSATRRKLRGAEA